MRSLSGRVPSGWEDVLDVYQRPYDPKRPQVCLDEASKQLLAHQRAPLAARPRDKGYVGQLERVDYEYTRQGVANLFMVTEPLRGWRHVAVTEQRRRVDFAAVVKDLVDVQYPDAEVIVLVLDNLNTHSPASLYACTRPSSPLKRSGWRINWRFTTPPSTVLGSTWRSWS